MILDATGADQIHAGLTTAADTITLHADGVSALAGTLVEAATRYEQAGMAPSTVSLLCDAAASTTSAHTHLAQAAAQLHAATGDFTARDGRVAHAVAQTGNLMRPEGYTATMHLPATPAVPDAVPSARPAAITGQHTPDAEQRADDAVLDAWRQVKMIDTSPAALQLRARAEQVRRRRQPAPAANPYTGTLTLDELGVEADQPLEELAARWRSTAQMFDNNARGGAPDAADDALFWHAAADLADATVAHARAQAGHHPMQPETVATRETMDADEFRRLLYPGTLPARQTIQARDWDAPAAPWTNLPIRAADACDHRTRICTGCATKWERTTRIRIVQHRPVAS